MFCIGNLGFRSGTSLLKEANRSSKILSSSRAFKNLFNHFDTSRREHGYQDLLFKTPEFTQQVARTLFWQPGQVGELDAQFHLPTVKDPDVRNRIAKPLLDAFATLMGPDSKMTNTQIMHLEKLFTSNESALEKIANKNYTQNNSRESGVSQSNFKSVLTDLLTAAGLPKEQIESAMKNLGGSRHKGIDPSTISDILKNPLSRVESIKQEQAQKAAAQKEANDGASSSAADTARFANA